MADEKVRDESHEVLIPDVVQYPAHIDHAQSSESLNANTTATKGYLLIDSTSNMLRHPTIRGQIRTGRIAIRGQATCSLLMKDTCRSL